MRKYMVFALYCLSLSTWAQSIDEVLQQVEQNNQQLMALSRYVEGRQLELKATNNLPDPQFQAYYLPGGTHSTGDYSEIELSQRLEFPTVYALRKDLIDQQAQKLQLEYRSQRQQILAQAQQHCLTLVHLYQRQQRETLRRDQARQVLDQVQQLFDQEQIGILELNKAKVAWMQDQFTLQQIEQEVKNQLLLLQSLNGNKQVTFNSRQYQPLMSLNLDSLWQSKQQLDPALLQLQQQISIAQQSLKVSKGTGLPNLTAGYNSQGFSGERFSGLYAGLSIPLWSNKHKVKAAQSMLEYQQSYGTASRQQAYAAFEKQYYDYVLKRDKFQEYQNTLTGLNSEALLLQAYQLGELSFLEYYMELQFYRQAYDAMLDMQLQLHLAQTELLKHQL